REQVLATSSRPLHDRGGAGERDDTGANIGRQFRRHIPPLLVLSALAVLIVAIARPTASVTLELPPDIRTGIVTFAGTASVVQRPTRSREDLLAAIDRFEMQRHTAIGSGIILSLATIFPDRGIDLESAIFGSAFSRANTRGAPIDRKPKEQKQEFKPVAPGSYPSAAIVLLTDGRRTTGPDPLDAARMAADHGVRVFTVGFGSAAGGAVDIYGMSIYMRFDEETLKAIADITRAEYFHAASAADLKKVYENLNSRFALEKTETEITALLTVAAAIMVVAAAILSLLWSNRLG
ncbi:MAG: VWA domain-containing protein, partial [Betaproteobacteria bacterium]|nr:VWA domain-containing protein [Betaproteobacteria bacterium]